MKSIKKKRTIDYRITDIKINDKGVRMKIKVEQTDGTIIKGSSCCMFNGEYARGNIWKKLGHPLTLGEAIIFAEDCALEDVMFTIWTSDRPVTFVDIMKK